VYKNLTITDGLTNLYNRRYFDDSLSKEMARSTRHDNSLSLIMLDVDNFKNYNDTYGHPEGDEVLKDIGSIIKSSIRKIDVPCRYGGEEFAVILPETTKDNAVILAERIRERLVEKRFFPQGNRVNVSASFGVAQYIDEKSSKEFIQRADEQLYQAKEKGKNKICFD